MSFSADVLKYDTAQETERIAAQIRGQVANELKRRGAVVGVSGGIDSSVVAGLCAKALGPNKVQALLMPERDSAEETLALSRAVTECFGIAHELEEITAILEGTGCYQRRDQAIRDVVPEFGPGCRSKIVLPGILKGDNYNLYSVVVEKPDGERISRRLPLKANLQIVAATNFKQRVRKMLEYYYADKLHYAVAGTPNRLEYDQGFFVKNGDGSADFKPIAHLYKTQVFMMARELGLPDEVCNRLPTTDTYSLPQGQDEFYFSLPYDKMDLCLYGKNHGVPPAEVAPVLDLNAEQVERVYRDIDKKRATTRYMHLAPQLAGTIPEIGK